MSINVAIDGPAGAGKSTIAKLVSKEMNYIYVDTGAMYRAMAVYMIDEDVNPEDSQKIAQKSNEVDVTIKYVAEEQRVFLNGIDVTGRLRLENVGKMASVVAAVPKVRENLMDLQQKLASEHDVVMDGRDIGTTVLPNAQVKIYLTASSAVRAKRRCDELRSKGENPDVKVIEKDIIERDMRDMNREISPLKQAEDAYLLDSSDMTIEEVAAAIIAKIKERI